MGFWAKIFSLRALMLLLGAGSAGAAERIDLSCPQHTPPASPWVDGVQKSKPSCLEHGKLVNQIRKEHADLVKRMNEAAKKYSSAAVTNAKDTASALSSVKTMLESTGKEFRAIAEEAEKSAKKLTQERKPNGEFVKSLFIRHKELEHELEFKRRQLNQYQEDTRRLILRPDHDKHQPEIQQRQQEFDRRMAEMKPLAEVVSKGYYPRARQDQSLVVKTSEALADELKTVAKNSHAKAQQVEAQAAQIHPEALNSPDGEKLKTALEKGEKLPLAELKDAPADEPKGLWERTKERFTGENLPISKEVEDRESLIRSALHAEAREGEASPSEVGAGGGESKERPGGSILDENSDSPYQAQSKLGAEHLKKYASTDGPTMEANMAATMKSANEGVKSGYERDLAKDGGYQGLAKELSGPVADNLDERNKAIGEAYKKYNDATEVTSDPMGYVQSREDPAARAALEEKIEERNRYVESVCADTMKCAALQDNGIAMKKTFADVSVTDNEADRLRHLSENNRSFDYQDPMGAATAEAPADSRTKAERDAEVLKEQHQDRLTALDDRTAAFERGAAEQRALEAKQESRLAAARELGLPVSGDNARNVVANQRDLVASEPAVAGAVAAKSGDIEDKALLDASLRQRENKDFAMEAFSYAGGPTGAISAYNEMKTAESTSGLMPGNVEAATIKEEATSKFKWEAGSAAVGAGVTGATGSVIVDTARATNASLKLEGRAASVFGHDFSSPTLLRSGSEELSLAPSGRTFETLSAEPELAVARSEPMPRLEAARTEAPPSAATADYRVEEGGPGAVVGRAAEERRVGTRAIQTTDETRVPVLAREPDPVGEPAPVAPTRRAEAAPVESDRRPASFASAAREESAPIGESGAAGREPAAASAPGATPAIPSIPQSSGGTAAGPSRAAIAPVNPRAENPAPRPPGSSPRAAEIYASSEPSGKTTAPVYFSRAEAPIQASRSGPAELPMAPRAPDLGRTSGSSASAPPPANRTAASVRPAGPAIPARESSAEVLPFAERNPTPISGGPRSAPRRDPGEEVVSLNRAHAASNVEISSRGGGVRNQPFDSEPRLQSPAPSETLAREEPRFAEAADNDAPGKAEKKGFFQRVREKVSSVREELEGNSSSVEIKQGTREGRPPLAEIKDPEHPSRNPNAMLKNIEEKYGVADLDMEPSRESRGVWNREEYSIRLRDDLRKPKNAASGKGTAVHEATHMSSDVNQVLNRLSQFDSDTGRVYGKKDLGRYSSSARADELDARVKQLASLRKDRLRAEQALAKAAPGERAALNKQIKRISAEERKIVSRARIMMERERELTVGALRQLDDPRAKISFWDLEKTPAQDRFIYRFTNSNGQREELKGLVLAPKSKNRLAAMVQRQNDIETAIIATYGAQSRAAEQLRLLGKKSENGPELTVRKNAVPESSRRMYRMNTGVDDVALTGFLRADEPLKRSAIRNSLQDRLMRIDSREANLEKHYGRDTTKYDFGSTYKADIRPVAPPRNPRDGKEITELAGQHKPVRPWGEEQPRAKKSPYAERMESVYAAREPLSRDPASIPRAERKMQHLAEEHSQFKAIGAEDNRRFISLAEAANAGQATELKMAASMQAAIGKFANDVMIKNKDVVNQVFNLQKSLIWEKVSRDPLLSKHLIGQYSDFNTVRLAFDSNEKAISQRLAQVFSEYNGRYAEFIDKVSRAKGWDKKAMGLAEKRENWHHLGIGSTPDEANLAARKSRELLDENGLAHPRTYEEVKSAVAEDLNAVERRRVELENKFGDTPGMFVGPRGERVLSAEANEAIRKAEQSSAGVRKALEKQFDTKISEAEVAAFRDYVNKADSFSPDLYVAERVDVPLDARRNGVVSADFKGQNARNLEESMKAMVANRGKPLEEQIRAIRAGEAEATKALEAKKADFRRAVEEQFGKVDPEWEKHVYFTGDDGIYLPAKKLLAEDKAAFASRFSDKPDNLRLTFGQSHFVDNGLAIPRNALGGNKALSDFVVEAEKVEKDLRRGLMNTFQREVTNNTQIVVDMTPRSDGTRSVGLYLGGQHTPEQMQAIRAWSQKFLRGRGDDLDFVKELGGADRSLISDAIWASEMEPARIGRAPAGAELVKEERPPSSLAEARQRWLENGEPGDIEDYGRSVPPEEAVAEYKRLAQLRSPKNMPASPGEAYYQQQVNYLLAQKELVSSFDNEDAFGGLEKAMDMQFKLDEELKKNQTALKNAIAQKRP